LFFGFSTGFGVSLPSTFESSGLVVSTVGVLSSGAWYSSVFNFSSFAFVGV